MLSPSDYNIAVPKFTNGNYSSNPEDPSFVEEPSALEYNKGAEPLQTLPAQWWNWFGNQFTSRFNKLNIYVKNIFDELAQLLMLFNITPSGTEESPTVAQLKNAFQTEYPKYLALIMYPVGSIYWTSKAPNDGGNPNILFGGTWTQIKDKFIWAKGDSDALNATGGSKTVTLTTQQIPSHHHGMNNHSHTLTPSGSISVTTNPSFTANREDLSFTPSGTISVNTNPTFTGSPHTHSYTPAGSISITTNPTFTGSAVNTGAMSANATSVLYLRNRADSSGNKYDTVLSTTGGFTKAYEDLASNHDYIKWNYAYSGKQASKITLSLAHTHSVTASGTISGGAYKFTGTSASLSATQGGTISGGKYTFVGANTTLIFTPSGSISGGAYSFSGNQGTTSQATGNTGSAGGGLSHENMPPYIVKYCWERTA